MGKIVVIEGTDFSGKTTQYEKLKERLYGEGIEIGSDSFPNYDSQSSYFVTEYLRGAFGENAEDIDPKVASVFYALDRFGSYKEREWGKVYDAGGNIVFARYITSNILHQAAKYHTWEEKKEFIDWLYSFEVGLMKLPKEDCVILLDMPPEMAVKLKEKRLKEQHGLSSNGSEKDIHEDNMLYLEKAYNTAIEVAKYLGWNVVHCLDDKGELRSIEDIHNEIYDIVKGVFQ